MGATVGDEVDRRVMDAAEALVAAFDALREARLALDDPRLSSGHDTQRGQGFSQATNRVESAARRAEEALRKCTVAAAAGRSPAAFAAYRLGDSRLAAARGELRGAARENEASGKAAHLSIAVVLIEQGLDATKDLIFVPEPGAAAPRGGNERPDEHAVFIPSLTNRPGSE
jgi:hypothetical protein